MPMYVDESNSPCIGYALIYFTGCRGFLRKSRLIFRHQKNVTLLVLHCRVPIFWSGICIKNDLDLPSQQDAAVQKLKNWIVRLPCCSEILFSVHWVQDIHYQSVRDASV
jgi:hypothetical protein